MAGDWLALADLANVAVRGTFSDVSDLIVYTSAVAVGGPYTIAAPFDAEFESIEFSDGQPVSSVRPVIDLRLADILPDVPAQDDTLTVRGLVYRVTDVQPGGHGTAKIFLVRDS